MAGEAGESKLQTLIRAIVDGDTRAALRALAGAPELARARAGETHFFEEIRHYVYAGDTALHLAAAARRPEVARKLIAAGADIAAKNRRGAEPLHYAADAIPGEAGWDPDAQVAVIDALLAAGADPNAGDKGGVTPLHRAVRNRCADAVKALLRGGADPQQKNKSGSTAVTLASLTTGRSGSGSPEAREQQEQILRLFREKRLAR